MGKLSGGYLRHANGSIAEIQGYRRALSRGEIGVQPPGVVTQAGPDFITYNPNTKIITVWDAKYSSTGRWPSTAKGFRSQAWLDAVKDAINSIKDPALKSEIMSAYNNGQIRWSIFTWP